jgi:hypothetical protein
MRGKYYLFTEKIVQKVIFDINLTYVKDSGLNSKDIVWNVVLFFAQCTVCAMRSLADI